MIQPEIRILDKKQLVGLRQEMSLAQNKTSELWNSFGPRVRDIQNRNSQDLISLQVYDSNYFREFSPMNPFEKWALAEVSSLDSIPEGMEAFHLKGGRYAVFHYKGSSADTSIFQYIFTEWLPNSGYQLDHRPHFEVLGEKYKNNDPISEEEIWIPIQ